MREVRGKSEKMMNGPFSIGAFDNEASGKKMARREPEVSVKLEESRLT
jgi:hypothetical protein